MSEISYHLLDDTKIIGIFTMFDRDNLQVELFDGLETMSDIPIDFYPEYMKGQRVFGTKVVKEWIYDRVIPSGRQNIDEILEKMGLEEYDELEIFLYQNGRYTQDSFSIQKIDGQVTMLLINT